GDRLGNAGRRLAPVPGCHCRDYLGRCGCGNRLLALLPALATTPAAAAPRALLLLLGCRLGHAVGRCNLELAVLLLAQGEHTTIRGLLEELVELREAERLLVEVRVQLEKHLLEPVRAHDVVVLDHLPERDLDELPGILAHR